VPIFYSSPCELSFSDPREVKIRVQPPALVYPGGDKFTATSLAHGVMEYWSVGVLIKNLEQR